MKAVTFHQYGTPDILKLEEVPKPVPGTGEVLVRLHATSVNSWDWELLRGVPFANRVMFGLFRPTRIKALGFDIAGRIEAVGAGVSRFRPGDEVFGDLSSGSWGGFAEYTCAKENELTLKPATMTFEQAAAMPQAGLLALQGLRWKGEIRSGQKVLINGAGGGAGSFAIQLAKAFGAEVTGVDTTEKLETMRQSGADHVVDFTREDYTGNGKQYDRILDCAAHHSILDSKRALAPGGVYAMMGGASGVILQAFMLAPLLSMAGSRNIGILMHKANKGMEELVGLFEDGRISPVIDRCYPLGEVREALRYFDAGHARGKVVITMES